MPLESEEQRHVTAAQGYAQLGMFLDADAELDKVDAASRHLPEVLAVRLEIYGGLKKWELAKVVADRLAKHEPENAQWVISRAYAARRAESIENAMAILIAGKVNFPDEPMISYNLACYCCQVGDLVSARNLLAEAFSADKNFRLMALDDEDLKPLWDSI